MKKEIIVITGSMERGGAEGVIAKICNELAKKGRNIKIISLLSDKQEYNLNVNIEYISLANKDRSTSKDSFLLVSRLRKKIAEIQPYLIISFMAKMNILTFFSIIGTKKHYIVSERNDPSVGRSYIYKKLVNLSYSCADAVVFQTSRARNFFSDRIKAKGVIIPNPVDTFCSKAVEKKRRIVAVGRLSKQKNHKLLIDSFESIHNNYPDYKLDIYGTGELLEEIQQYIKEKNLVNAINLMGKVENIPEQIKDAYMFVHTADYEGFSNALLEAMSIGLPCISTNCAGAEDAITNGVNGLIVPVGDREALVQAMDLLLRDKEYAENIGEKARRTTEKYSIKNIIKQWEELIGKFEII